MGWFANLCRNLGLMVHNVKHPEDDGTQTKVLRKQVEEEDRGNVTLRRTTIEEIEFKNDGGQPPKDDQGVNDGA